MLDGKSLVLDFASAQERERFGNSFKIAKASRAKHVGAFEGARRNADIEAQRPQKVSALQGRVSRRSSDGSQSLRTSTG